MSHGLSRRRFLGAGVGAGTAALLASTIAMPAAAATGRQAATDAIPFGIEPPFSFKYGNSSSAQLLASWPMTRVTQPDASGGRITTTTWSDASSGLRVRWIVTQYPNLPTMSWVVYFDNTGSSQSDVLADVLSCDFTVQGALGEWTIHTNNGSSAVPTDFAPLALTLDPNTFRLFTTNGGRPTNGNFVDAGEAQTNVVNGWPYLNIAWPDGGIIAALGWPGQWALQAGRDGNQGLTLRGGMSHNASIGHLDEIEATDLTSLWLEPGETISTPMVVVQPWRQGTWIDAQNVWRHWLAYHHMPQINGKPAPMLAPTQANDYFNDQAGPDGPDTEASELLWLNGYGDHHATAGTGGVLDHWWIDAGWTDLPPGDTLWVNVGSWEPDPNRFPNGLKPISDRAHELGMASLVWFEPERVMPRTWLYDNHPEWLLHAAPGTPVSPDGALLFDFGNPDDHAWAVSHFDGLITSQDIDFYREDFNMDPLPFWVYNDPAGRRGIKQIKYVEGHLGYWDTLRQRHPGLLIDSCASGGRRLDVRTLQSAINNIRSDFVLDPVGNQSHNFGIGSWVVHSGAAARVTGSPDDAYIARSAMAPTYHLALEVEHQTPKITGANLLSADDSSFEDSIGTATPNLNCTVSQSTAQALIGTHSLAVTAPGNGVMQAQQGPYPVTGGDTYLWQASYRASSNPASLQFNVHWYNGDTLLLPVVSGTVVNDTTTGWTQAVTAGQAPPTATRAFLFHFAFSGAPGDVHYVDDVGLFPANGVTDTPAPDELWATLRAQAAEWRAIANEYLGDYYPLSTYSTGSNVWMAWQFNRPPDIASGTKGSGIVQAFRRPDSTAAQMTYRLSGLQPHNRYTLIDYASGKQWTAYGRDLAGAGLSVSLAAAPSATTIGYQQT